MHFNISFQLSVHFFRKLSLCLYLQTCHPFIVEIGCPDKLLIVDTNRFFSHWEENSFCDPHVNNFFLMNFLLVSCISLLDKTEDFDLKIKMINSFSFSSKYIFISSKLLKSTLRIKIQLNSTGLILLCNNVWNIKKNDEECEN